MATRSMVLYKKEDGTLKGSYFHFDGYVEYMGVTLLKHYDSYDKAKALVDFSPANSGIEDSIEEMIEGEVAYKDEESHYRFDSIESLLMALESDEHSYIEFVYLFDKESNSWVFTIPNRISEGHYQVFFMDLKKYCIEKGINFND